MYYYFYVVVLLFMYAGEISPILPRSCRYIPTCSEYSMEAYKRYGVMKGTVLTAWRLCRCNPLGNFTSNFGFEMPYLVYMILVFEFMLQFWGLEYVTIKFN